MFSVLFSHHAFKSVNNLVIQLMFLKAWAKMTLSRTQKILMPANLIKLYYFITCNNFWVFFGAVKLFYVIQINHTTFVRVQLPENLLKNTHGQVQHSCRLISCIN